ncbi:MAG TPA: PA2169 family four-helix-bundle protein [Pyrinomonadaceae bacterium]|nr:PA2169 family four-helix-bundle protein [Pyrinomonadaceae bacterium]
MINDYEATEPIVPEADTHRTVDNDEVISTINGLIETCKDGQMGFKEASEGVERSDLKSFFGECSLQRSQFAGELQSLVRTLGGDPENSGSIAGTLHRGWINIKAAVTGKDEGSILNECERGEDSAKKAYKNALDGFLPDYMREVIQRQYDGVVAAHDKTKALRDAFNNQSTSAASSR